MFIYIYEINLLESYELPQSMLTKNSLRLITHLRIIYLYHVNISY